MRKFSHSLTAAGHYGNSVWDDLIALSNLCTDSYARLPLWSKIAVKLHIFDVECCSLTFGKNFRIFMWCYRWMSERISDRLVLWMSERYARQFQLALARGRFHGYKRTCFYVLNSSFHQNFNTFRYYKFTFSIRRHYKSLQMVHWR